LTRAVPPAFAQQQQGPTPNVQPAPGGGGGGYRSPYVPPISGGPATPGSFSTSVANTMTSVSVTAQGHLNSSSTLLASDYTAMATALQTFVNEEDSTGFTATIQTWLLANSALFTTTPTAAQIQAAYTGLNKSGTAVTVTEADFVSALQATPLAQRQKFISLVQANGLDYFYDGLISNLHQLAADAMNMRHGGVYLQAECLIPWAGIGASYFGIVALAVSGPVGWTIGAVAAVVAIGSQFGLFGGC
jgi:hypothetical protein